MTFDELKEHIDAISKYCDSVKCDNCLFGYNYVYYCTLRGVCPRLWKKEIYGRRREMTYDEMRKHIVAISDYCSETNCSKCPFGEFGGEYCLFMDSPSDWRNVLEDMEAEK